MVAEILAAFLLAFPALFSIVNPIGGAFIFREVTAERTHVERVRLARRVGVNALVVMLVALWAGSYVLAWFGISLAALRIAGGAVVAGSAWELMRAPERREGRKQQQAASAAPAPSDDIAFFPLTLPFTTGPGTISVAVALGAGHPASGIGVLPFFAGISLAATALAALIALLYGFADRLSELLGRNASRIVSRLVAFILLCIGVQILLTGINDALSGMIGVQPLTPATR